MTDKLEILSVPPSRIESLITFLPITEGDDKPLQDIAFVEINVR